MTWKYLEEIKLWEVKKADYKFYGSTLAKAIKTMEICSKLWNLKL